MKKLDPPKIKRLTIEGAVILKRKSVWVKRYAKIENCVLTYKSAQQDKKIKYSVDLRTSKVMLG